MDQITIKDLYNLEETIAGELFAGKTYPWEVLPEIGAFIVKLGNTLDPQEYEKAEKISGLPVRQKWRPRPPSQGLPSSEKKRKSARAPLSGATPS